MGIFEALHKVSHINHATKLRSPSRVAYTQMGVFTEGYKKAVPHTAERL
jgi:hypothetical protein